jgi:hypothetical protein
MASVSYIIEGGVDTRITFTELPDGSVDVRVEVLGTSGSIGDLRGLFLDVRDESILDDLIIDGADVTASAIKANGVTKVDGGNNVNGEVANSLGKFDFGLSFGSNGIGKDDIRDTTFNLSLDSGEPLTLADLISGDIALRYTSVGEEGGSRAGSLKIAGDLENQPPVATDDSAKICADEPLTINLLEGDSDPDGDTLTVTSISDDDETVGVGGSLTLADGATVTLNDDGTVSVDGKSAYASLGLGDTATDGFSYTIEDGNGGSAGADVTVEFCGYASEETVAALVEGAQIEYMITQAATLAGFTDGYALEIISSDNDAVPVGTYTAAYCIDSQQEFTTSEITIGNVLLATEANAAAVGSAGLNADNIDSVNWLLNNDQTLTDNGDGTGDTYTDFEVQEAIWKLMNGDDEFVFLNEFPFLEVTDNDNGVRDGLEIGTAENIMEIVDLAIAEGDGFEAQDGDIFGLIVEPTSPDGQEQPFIIGVEYECLC